MIIYFAGSGVKNATLMEQMCTDEMTGNSGKEERGHGPEECLLLSNQLPLAFLGVPDAHRLVPCPEKAVEAVRFPTARSVALT
jgi:hypothetical protein